MVRVLAITLAACAIVLEVYSRIFLTHTLGRGTVSLGMYRFDPLLGWNLNDGTFSHQSKDFSVAYTTAGTHRSTPYSAGCRGPDIALYGDSFVFGIGVSDDETIPNQLAKQTGVCVSNEGVSGYGPDQYYLRWKHDHHAARSSIFVIFTGNDYKDILGRADAGGRRQKPFLERAGEGYFFAFPSAESGGVEGSSDLFKSDEFLRFLAKRSPLIVKVRSAIVSADGRKVGSALERINFLLDELSEKNALFVLMPSASLVSGVSSSTDEGLFRRQLAQLFELRGIPYLDLYTRETLKSDDFFPNEGHTHPRANARIASAIAEFVAEVEGKGSVASQTEENGDANKRLTPKNPNRFLT